MISDATAKRHAAGTAKHIIIKIYTNAVTATSRLRLPHACDAAFAHVSAGPQCLDMTCWCGDRIYIYIYACDNFMWRPHQTTKTNLRPPHQHLKKNNYVNLASKIVKTKRTCEHRIELQVVIRSKSRKVPKTLHCKKLCFLLIPVFGCKKTTVFRMLDKLR